VPGFNFQVCEFGSCKNPALYPGIAEEMQSLNYKEAESDLAKLAI